MKNFKQFRGRHSEILKGITNITKPEYLPKNLPKNFIAIHIRRSDYPEKTNDTNQIYFKLPLEWYIKALDQIRNRIGKNFPVLVFSDGTEEEIAPILSLNNVHRSPYSESISDILAISKSTVIITSLSTYSLFGAFLGQVPSVWYSGKSNIYTSSYMGVEQKLSLEIEWMPGQILPLYFTDILKKGIHE